MPAPRDYKTARAMLAEYEARTHYKVLRFNDPLALKDSYQDGQLIVVDGLARELVRYFPDGRIRLTMPYVSAGALKRMTGLIPDGWKVDSWPHAQTRAMLINPEGFQTPFTKAITFHPEKDGAKRAALAKAS